MYGAMGMWNDGSKYGHYRTCTCKSEQYGLKQFMM
jgi:hypothetical protein